MVYSIGFTNIIEVVAIPVKQNICLDSKCYNEIDMSIWIIKTSRFITVNSCAPFMYVFLKTNQTRPSSLSGEGQ